ncbi:MAG: hypothetical protein GPJ54_06395 [Candidatus Heimdallarchaeota archaeon]|nr:hypothetical protein [Candidatus Heimdallarchaeota archaeon]
MSFHKNGLDVFVNQENRVKIDDSDLGREMTKNIAIARASVLLDYPFFGYIMGKLSIISTLENSISTFSVDTSSLYFNTNYVSNILEIHINWKERLKGDLIHLVLHLIYDHTIRKKERDKKLWGFASDVIVYQIMVDLAIPMGRQDSWSIPSMTQIPEEMLNISTERVYKLLLDNLEPQDNSSQTENQQIENDDFKDQINQAMANINDKHKNQFPDDISDFTNHLCDMDNWSEHHKNQEIDRLNNSLLSGIIRDAYERSKQRGELPSNIKRFLNNKFNSKTNWRIKLSSYLQRVIGFDTTWRIPNKRHIQNGYYFPSTSKENIQLLIAIDTSGSIDTMVLQQFLAEIEMIMNQISNVRIILVECDADIQNISFIEAGERMKIDTFQGGGGTDFRPVFDLIGNYDIDLIIYFTDGHGTYPKKPVIDPPVLWILSEDYEVPFGTKIKI